MRGWLVEMAKIVQNDESLCWRTWGIGLSTWMLETVNKGVNKSMSSCPLVVKAKEVIMRMNHQHNSYDSHTLLRHITLACTLKTDLTGDADILQQANCP